MNNKYDTHIIIDNPLDKYPQYAMTSIVFIPARYESTRFPGKPLAMLGSKPMIQWVVERAQSLGTRVVVATDHEGIRQCVEAFGAEAVMTSPKHQSGTERIIEAYQSLGVEADVIVNLQGDEPFVRPEQIHQLLSAFDDPETEIATLCEAFDASTPDAVLHNPNVVKVLRNAQGRALYFSRQAIPYLRGVEHNWCQHHRYFKHIGLYAFRGEILRDLKTLPPSPSEQAESLEQLRWLEAGYCLRVMETTTATIGIDTPEDLARAEALLRTQGEP